MLFKKNQLEGIRSGKITVAFRKWEKASVKSGSLLHTSIGIVEIGKVQIITENNIKDSDVLNAGYRDKNELLKSFPKNQNGNIYKIAVGFYSEDPRIELREQTKLSEQELNDLLKKLDRLDKSSKQGIWITTVLRAIKANPKLHAVGLAKLTGHEKAWLKLKIMKLKNLGLTISHTIGYELSPRGEILLKKLTGGK